MQTTASAIFKDLDENRWYPLYLIWGEEPFQMQEIVSRLRAHFVKDPLFQFERFDGDALDLERFSNAIQMMPSLFDEPGSTRLILCNQFDKVPASAIESVEALLEEPSPGTCLCLTASKIDRRKSWVKKVEARGVSIEVKEPYERDWPRWLTYFERKIGRKIDPSTWQNTIVSCQGNLSLVNAELEKLATYVGEKTCISSQDTTALTLVDTESDPFAFIEDVLNRRKLKALRRYQALCRSGESDVKLLSLILRQVRMVRDCKDLQNRGIRDTKAIGTTVGISPFFVPKLIEQSAKHTEKSLLTALRQLSLADYQLKTSSAGSLLEHFLIPYFSI